MRIQSEIKLRYETSPDQLRFVLIKLRELLISHPKVVKDNRIRVRLQDFGEYSFDIDFFAHIDTTKWYEYLAIKEDIFLRVAEIVQNSGTKFAFPSRTMYQEAGVGIDDSKTQNVEKTIKSMRKKSNLPFPDFNIDQYKDLHNKMEYPPMGSVPRPKGA